MKIILFGATGMVGDGVLRWLIASPRVSRVVAVSRKPLAVQHPKLEIVIEANMFHLRHVDALRDFDACFFCLGASSVGMSPEDYRRLTYDLTVGVARQLLPGNPRMVFEYVSGEGTVESRRRRFAKMHHNIDGAVAGLVGFPASLPIGDRETTSLVGRCEPEPPAPTKARRGLLSTFRKVDVWNLPSKEFAYCFHSELTLPGPLKKSPTPALNEVVALLIGLRLVTA